MVDFVTDILLLARRMGQYCFARGRLSSSSVTLPAVGLAGRRERKTLLSAERMGGRQRRRMVGQSCLCPVRVISCFTFEF